MPTLSALELFAVAAFALIIVPGPAVLYIVSQSVGQGRVGGLAAPADDADWEEGVV